jgi:hypothetical protein
MSVLASPRLAIGGGLLLAALETVRRWGHWPYLPFLLDDYIAGAFLVFGGMRSFRDAHDGQRFLAAAWAFACGMGYMSFFGHLYALQNPPAVAHVARVSEGTVTAVVGTMFFIAVAALVATLRSLEVRGSERSK